MSDKSGPFGFAFKSALGVAAAMVVTDLTLSGVSALLSGGSKSESKAKRSEDADAKPKPKKRKRA